MSKYAYIMAGDLKYLPELTANLNSLDFVGNKQDVILIGIHLPDDFIAQLDKLNYNVIYKEISEEEVTESRGISEVTCRKRYWYAAEYGQDYDAVCVLDADLIWGRDAVQFFDIAAKTGFILGPHKEQNQVYNRDHHMTNGKWEWKTERGFWNDKDMCNCPVFIDAKVWEEALRKEWNIFINEGFKAPDMDAMNLCFLEYGSYDKTIKLTGNQWLGTNEQHLKPYIRVVTKNNGKIWTETGSEVFCYHGHYYHEKWRSCQLSNRSHCASGYLKATEESLLSCNNIAKGSMNLLYENFMKMLDWKIQIPHTNYRPA